MPLCIPSPNRKGRSTVRAACQIRSLATLPADMRVSGTATGIGRRPLSNSFITMRRITADRAALCGRVIERFAAPVLGQGICEEGLAVSG